MVIDGATDTLRTIEYPSNVAAGGFIWKVQVDETDSKLYFDKGTGYLVKIERRAPEAGLMVDKEYLYSAHKAFEGVQLPTRYVEITNGRKFVEAVDLSYQFLSAVDDKMFARP